MRHRLRLETWLLDWLLAWKEAPAGLTPFALVAPSAPYYGLSSWEADLTRTARGPEKSKGATASRGAETTCFGRGLRGTVPRAGQAA